MVDFRVEKQMRFGDKARVAVFFDLFNVFNSNTAVNINWRSGASFEKRHDGARTAHREVRREVRLVGRMLEQRLAASG